MRRRNVAASQPTRNGNGSTGSVDMLQIENHFLKIENFLSSFNHLVEGETGEQ